MFVVQYSSFKNDSKTQEFDVKKKVDITKHLKKQVWLFWVATNKFDVNKTQVSKILKFKSESIKSWLENEIYSSD